jgi:hypothetical protein
MAVSLRPGVGNIPAGSHLRSIDVIKARTTRAAGPRVLGSRKYRGILACGTSSRLRPSTLAQRCFVLGRRDLATRYSEVASS